MSHDKKHKGGIGDHYISYQSPSMPCSSCPPSDNKHPNPKPDDKCLSIRALRLTSSILPEGSALLSSSCCWLPTLLNLIFAGSVTAASIEKLCPVFLAISILTLAWGIRREGFNGSMIRRAIICAGLVAWSQYNQKAETVEGHHSCH